MPRPFTSPCWERYLAATALHDDISARNLILLQASEVIAHLVGNNLMVVTPQISFDGSCTIDLHARNGRLNLASNVFDGVAVRQRQRSSRPPSNGTAITNVTPRLIVMTHRLARYLKHAWGVTEIYHKGMGQGRGPAGDPHNSGRAIDFSGALTRVGPFFVSRDWGDRRVTVNGQRQSGWPATHEMGDPFGRRASDSHSRATHLRTLPNFSRTCTSSSRRRQSMRVTANLAGPI
jgi:hypothetical protein